MNSIMLQNRLKLAWEEVINSINKLCQCWQTLICSNYNLPSNKGDSMRQSSSDRIVRVQVAFIF